MTENPWLKIPLGDYESHMAYPSIGQAALLADQFERLVLQHSPKSVALIGCAGGNGLERLAPGQVERIVAVDINPDYVERTNLRHARRLSSLELLCADVQSESLSFEQVELVYAALLFEYVDVAAALATIKRNCHAGAILATVLQLPHESQATVSSSPYTSLGALAAAFRLIAPEELSRCATAAGFVPVGSESLAAPSGKRFCIQIFTS
jgi:hypothetical protein